LDWIGMSGRVAGPVFSGIDRWGNVSDTHMTPQSILPLLRRILAGAGNEEARSYSSHSLRRGFAGWASANGWDLKELMEHVGWRDVSSALRYIDAPRDALKGEFEGLAVTPPGLGAERARRRSSAVMSAYRGRGCGVKRAEVRRP
jgi:integrase